MTPGANKYPAYIFTALLAAVIAAISILAWVPPVSRDALIHHLAIPKLYLEQGAMVEIPYFKFSYYPMNLDLLYLAALYFKTDIFPKFIHFAFALATGGMIYGYLAPRLNKVWALLGVLFFLSIPIVVRLSTEVYVDLGLMCFLFASLLFLVKWIRTGFMLKPLVFSAICCGLALGTKYNGLIGLFLITLFIPFIYSRKMRGHTGYAGKAVGHAAVFVIVSLIVFSPWMIRNYAWTNNPVYPLYNSFFNPPEPAASSETNKDENRSLYQIRGDLYGESLLEIVLIPLRVFFQGQDNNPKYFDGRLNPFLLFLPIFAFLGAGADSRAVKTEKRVLLAFSVLFLLFVYVQTVMRIRYFIPIVPPLVILSIFGLFNIGQSAANIRGLASKSISKLILSLLVLVMLALNGLYIMERFAYVQPMSYISGRVSRSEYIQSFRPEFAAFEHANTHLSSNSKILAVYVGNRGYYCDQTIRFDLDLLQELAAEAKSPRTVYDSLVEKGFTHVLINYELFNNWVKSYSLHEKKILKSFFEDFTATRFSKDGYGLLRLTPGPPA